MAKIYLGKKLQDLGHVETVVPEDKIVIVKEKDEGVLSLSEFFFYVKENLDFSNYVTIKDARETFARKDSVYTKDITDAKYAFVDRVYTRVVSDEKYAVKGSTHSKEYIDTNFPHRSEVYAKENTYSKPEAFSIFALKTEIPILPDLRPYSTTADGDKRWASISQGYTKPQSDELFALRANTYTKLETDALYALDADTFTKDEADLRFLNTDEGYNRTFINNNFYYKPDLYTRDESNTRFPRRDEVYMIGAVNDQFAAKSWVYSRAEALTTFPLASKTYSKTEVNSLLDTRAAQTETELRTGYYTKINTDAKFAEKVSVYTKTEADSKYAPRSESMAADVIRQDFYTKVVVDAKFAALDFTPYLTKVDAVATYAPITSVYTKEATNALIYTRAVIDGKLTTLKSDMAADVARDYITSTLAATTYAPKISVYTKLETDATYARLDKTYSRQHIDANLYTQAQLDSKLAQLNSTLSTAIVNHAYGKVFTDTTYANKAESAANFALKTDVFTKPESDARFVNVTKYESDLAVISNDNYLGLVLNGHAKNEGKVGVTNLRVVTRPNGERIIELIDPMVEAILAKNIRPRINSVFNLNALVRYKNNPAQYPSIRVAIRYFDTYGTELKLANLPDSNKTYVLSRTLAVGDSLLYTNSFDKLSTLKTAPVFIMGVDLTLRKVSNALAYPPSGTTNWWDGVGQVVRGTAPNEAQATLKTAWNYPNPNSSDGIWPVGTVISIPANPSEADINAPLLYHTVNAADTTKGIPWGRINKRLENIETTLTGDGSRSYNIFESLKAQISIIPQGNELEFVGISVEHESQSEFNEVKDRYFTKTTINDDFIRKVDYTNYGYTKGEVYTKAESDNKYPLKTDVYTKTESNNNLSTAVSTLNNSLSGVATELNSVKSNYATTAAVASVYFTKTAATEMDTALRAHIGTIATTVTGELGTNYYNKVTSDGRFLLRNATSISTAVDGGLGTTLRKDGIGFNKDGPEGAYLTREFVDGSYVLKFHSYHNVTTSTKSDFLRLGPESVWTNAYGNLHDYFAKKSDVWAKSEVYTKSEVYSKTETDGLYIPKSIVTLNLASFDVNYTQAQSTGVTANGYKFNVAGPLAETLTIRAMVSPNNKVGIGYYTKTSGPLFAVDSDGTMFNMGVSLDSKYAPATTTYSKTQVDSIINAVKADTMGTASLTEKFAERYTKTEADSKFVTQTAVNNSYLSKSDAIDTYSSKATSESTYAKIANVYTRDELYTRTQTTSLFYQRSDSSIFPVMGSTGTVKLNNTPFSALGNSGHVAFEDKTGKVVSTMGTTGGNGNVITLSTLQATGILGPSLSVSNANIWHNTYGNLHDYFRKVSDSYAKTEVYTKSESDARYAYKADSYTKAESNNLYPLKDTVYSIGYLDAQISGINTALTARYTKVESDAKYYDKGESDNRYYTKAEVNARGYTKAESDGKYRSINASNITHTVATDAIFNIGLTLSKVSTTSPYAPLIEFNLNDQMLGLASFEKLSSGVGSFLLDIRGSGGAVNRSLNISDSSIWHSAYGYLHDYFAKRTEILTKSEISATYATKGDVYAKGAVYSRVESDARYYTKAESDAGYALKTEVYTKAQSDSLYYTKSLLYTKSESDSRFMPKIPTRVDTSGNTTSTYDVGLSIHNTNANSGEGPSVQFHHGGKLSAMLYSSRGNANASSDLHVWTAHGNGTAWATMRISYDHIWTNAYGNLHDYFAKKSDVWAKSEVYTKSESDGKYMTKTPTSIVLPIGQSPALSFTSGNIEVASIVVDGGGDGGSSYIAMMVKRGSEVQIGMIVSAEAIYSTAYGELGQYFAKKSEVYTASQSDNNYYYKNQVYTKGEVLSFLNAADTRDANLGPAAYISSHATRQVREFKSLASIGLGHTGLTYGALVTSIPYGDSSGGYPTQSLQTTNNRLFIRGGVTNSAWSEWVEMETVAATAAKYHTKGVVDAWFMPRNEVYSKSESDGRYAYKGDAYTRAQSDSRYEYTGTGYTKSQSDAKYATITWIQGLRVADVPYVQRVEANLMAEIAALKVRLGKLGG